MDTEEPAWTKENLQKLLTAMKSNVPESERNVKYSKTLGSLDWAKVAFEPFSAKDCQQKWIAILDKMRKIRSLTELINEAEDVIANPVKNHKIHPEFPKRPRPPACLYFMDYHAELRKQHPELIPTQLLKLAFEKFETLSDNEKAPYVTKFTGGIEEYNVKMKQFRKEYNLKPNNYQSEKRRRKRKEVSADDEDCNGQANVQPCRPPLTGYNLFCSEQQADVTGNVASERLSVWAKRWKCLSKGEKADYTKRCSKMKEEYKIKLKEYEKGLDEKQHQQFLILNGKPEERRKKPCEPKMPSLSGTEAYIQEQMEVLKQKIPNSNRRLLVIKKQWQKLCMMEKTYYKDKAMKDKEQYSARLQRWFKMLNSEEQKNYLKDNPDKFHYLHTKPENEHDTGQEAFPVPSDSEDEETEDSSDEEEVNYVDLKEENEEEQEGDDDDSMVDVY